MKHDKKANKRYQYFIKSEFQYKFIFKFCLLVILGAIISSCLLYFFSKDTLTTSFNDSKIIIETTAASIFPAIIFTNIFTLLFITLATIIVTIFVSHKIAGPMFRLETGLQAVSLGDLTQRINFRKKDQVEVLAEKFNEMSASLHGKLTEIELELKQIQKLSEQQNIPREINTKLLNLINMLNSKFKL